MQSRYMEGSEERKKIDREVYTLRNQLVDESYQNSMDWIEKEKNYGRMSLADELAAISVFGAGMRRAAKSARRWT